MDSMSMPTATGQMASMSMSMPMGSATASPGSMEMGTDAMMPMSMMAMTFFASTTTPLFSKAWTPTSTGVYAGTCIFLIVFAAIFRALIAIRFNFDRFSARIARGRGDNQTELYVDELKGAHRPWRAGEAVALGAMDVVIAGVSYLL